MSLEIPTKEKEPVFEEIVELADYFEIILDSGLDQLIESGDYDLIIGIDASGRIPALTLGGYIDRVYKDKGYPPPLRRFVAGSAKKVIEIRDLIRQWNPQKRVLVVEDTIVWGDSIKNLCEVLKSLNISFDIVSIGDSSVGDDSLRYLGARNIYSGMLGTPSIYGKHRIGGVGKYDGQTFSEPTKNNSVHPPESIQAEINQARDDVDWLVGRLVELRAKKMDKKNKNE